jgi:prephenate dehydrogenase
METEFKKVTILGVGLIGASFALAMKGRSLCGHVAGYGRTESNLRSAKEKGIIDSYSLDAAAASEGADLVVFATPVGRFMPLAAEIEGALKKGAVVIDVGSVKGSLVYGMEGLMPEGVRFLGCHPIAGGESSGIETSRAELFRGALCVITPTERTGEDLVDKVAGIFKSLGSKVKLMSPEKHDRVYGLVSHFPHLAAYAMVDTVGDIGEDSLNFAGRGFKDTTRVALSSPELWQEICSMNRENLLQIIAAFRENMDMIEKCLEENDPEGLRRLFERARKLRGTVGN